jgi:hypothetical protein
LRTRILTTGRRLSAGPVLIAGLAALSPTLAACGGSAPVEAASVAQEKLFSQEESELRVREAEVHRQEAQEREESRKQEREHPASNLTTLAPAGTRGPAPGKIPQPYVRFARGEWTATGTTLETQAADGSVGEVSVRPWDFKRVCEHGSCHMNFWRQTQYRFEETRLQARGARYVAVFPPESVPCPHRRREKIRTGEDYSSLTLWWSADHQTVDAVEHARYVSSQCLGFTERTRWVARRTDPSAPTPALGP